MPRFLKFWTKASKPTLIDPAQVAAVEPSGDQTLVFVPGGTLTLDMPYDEVAGMVDAASLREERVAYDPFDGADSATRVSRIMSMTRAMRGQ